MNEQPMPRFASFGRRSWIEEPSRVSCAERIDVGADVYIGAGSWLSVVDEHLGCRYDPHLVIGNGVSLGPGIVISCTGRVEIGDRVLAASRVFIGDSYHDYRDPDAAVSDQPMSDPDPVYIGSGAFLGIGAIILPGVTVGEHAYVGAGAVVTRDVPPRAVVAGNPARIIRRWYADRQAWIGVTAPGEPERLRDPRTDAPTPTVDRNTTDVDKRVAALVHRAALGDAKLATCDEEVRALEAERDRLLARAVEVERRAADAERRAADAEFWLEQHRRSLSWRLTAPLRAAKRGWVSRTYPSSRR